MKKNNIIVISLGVLLIIVIILLYTVSSNNSGVYSITSSSTDVTSSSTTKSLTTSDVVDYTVTKKPVSHIYIDASNLNFTPQAVTINAGTKVTWVNNDNIIYTITADNGGPSSTGLSNGQSYSFTYRVKGIYGYHSSEYQSMNGTVIVK